MVEPCFVHWALLLLLVVVVLLLVVVVVAAVVVGPVLKLLAVVPALHAHSP
jgi:hypothetical protein